MKAPEFARYRITTCGYPASMEHASRGGAAAVPRFVGIIVTGSDGKDASNDQARRHRFRTKPFQFDELLQGESAAKSAG